MKKQTKSMSNIPQVVQDHILPLSKVIQVLTKSQDIVSLPASSCIDPPSFHATAETADGGTLIGQVHGSFHDAWDKRQK